MFVVMLLILMFVVDDDFDDMLMMMMLMMICCQNDFCRGCSVQQIKAASGSLLLKQRMIMTVDFSEEV